MTRITVVALLCAWILPPASWGQLPAGLQGVFLNEYESTASGSTASGTEYVQIAALGEPGAYRITDIYGKGFEAQVDGAGAITLEGGTGSADGPDSVTVTLDVAEETWRLRRVFMTDAAFQQTLSRSPDMEYEPPAVLTGDWDIVEYSLDPVTGERLPQQDGSLEFVDVFTIRRVLLAGQQGLRVVDSAGTYFQGAQDTGRDVVIRIIENSNADIADGFETIAGSANNFARDVLGFVHFPDANSFKSILLLQTQQQRDSRRQFLLEIDGTRQVALPPGDLDGDGQVNATDESLLADTMGRTVRDPGFNLAADLDGNDWVDARDASLIAGDTPSRENVDAAFTGLWFDSTRSGEGWHITMIDERRAFVTWFTYAETGNVQAWLVGNGEWVDGELAVPELVSTRGPSFGPGFDPDAVVRESWGSARFYLTECGRGGMAYSSRGGDVRGVLGVERLTSSPGVDCGSIGETNVPTAPFTGVWFDPSHSGEGWIVHGLADNRVALTWFTYDDNGEQFWLLGTGTVNETTLTIDELTYTRGTVFGVGFDPDEVERIPWGSLEFSLTDCRTGSLSYASTLPPFGSGTLRPERLAGAAAVSCQLP